MSFLSFLVFNDWLLLVVVIFFLLYIRATRHRNYWKNQKLVHEKLSLFFGPQLKQLFKPLHTVDQELYKKHGRLFGTFEDGKPVLYVADPELIKLVLVKDASQTQRKVYELDDPILSNLMINVEPEKWKKIRAATSPAFTSGKLRKMQAIIDSCAVLTSERLREAAKESRDVDTKGFYGHFSLDAVASCSFGAKLSTYSQEGGSFVRAARNAFFVRITLPVILKAFLQKLSDTFHRRIFNREAFDFYKYATMDIMKKREESNIKHEDFLQMMMNATEASKEVVASTEQSILNPEVESSLLKSNNIKNLSEVEALSQCVLFFLAGQDTASTTTSFASYLLAVYPQVQDRLRAEVDDCFRKHGSSPSYDEVSKLPYLDCVVNETLRIMPPGVRLERTPAQDYVLGDAGITVPGGCNIVIPVYSMHKDPEFFPEPEVFNPDRFAEENVGSIRPYTYLPFGAGPRNCVGMRFAIQLVKTCLVHAVHNVQLVRSSSTKVPLEFQPGFGILTPKDLVVGIRERSS